MDVRLATFSSDEINRYGYSIGVQALAGALEQAWEGTPMFVSHDYHRLLGVSRPIGLQLHASRALLRGEICLATTDDDVVHAELFARRFFARKILEVDPDEKAALLALLKEAPSVNSWMMRRECVTVIDAGIAKRQFPDLFPTNDADKRSLINISELDAIAPGVFKIGELVVFAHRYFRRSLSQINNTNEAFLRKFIELKKNSELVVKIALDPDSLGLASSYLTPIELEYWRGPKFDDDLTSIPVGVSVHKASERERFFHCVDRTEFFWHTQNGTRSFECEELLDQESLGIGADAYGCRYAHSIIDDGTGLPNPLDGAIRVYDTEQYLERIDTDISKAGKKSHYVKLWRVDGPLELATWKELVCDFYRGNPLPGEYLSAPPQDAMAGTQEPELQAPRSDLMPLEIAERNSVQIAVSYHYSDEYPDVPACGLVPGIGVNDNGISIKTIELSALDLVKLTQRELGHQILLSPDIVHVAIEDMDINHPLVIFSGASAATAANTWKSALSKICERFNSRGEKRFITANVGIDYGEVTIRFAFAGFAGPLANAATNLEAFPASLDQIGIWCTSSYDYLKQNFDNTGLASEVSDLFRLDGTFRLDRPYIDPSLLLIDEKNTVSIRLPPEEVLVAEALDVGQLSAVTSVYVRACTCAGCNSSYLSCSCSALVDEDVSVSCERIEKFRLVMTERPADRLPA